MPRAVDHRVRAMGALPLRLGLVGLVLFAGAGVASMSFREVSGAWGVDFRHHHGGSGRRYVVETMSGGVVVFDFDGDGDEDLFFVDGGSLPGYEGDPARSRLFRNDGGGRFVDVTRASGIEVAAYGNGAAAGDVDGDGDPDLYVTQLGANQLFRNEGDGSFRDMTAEAGVGDELWSTSAALADVDHDGDLDLYVANYIAFTVAGHRDCRDEHNGLLVYCHPSRYPGLPDRFYRNRGDGTFVDATREAGFAGVENMAGLGVAFGDLDDDGWIDLYVANDTEPNFLFLNKGDGTFEETSFLAGTAVSERGMVEAGMGVDFGDVDGDGRLDIVVTNFEMETNALYKNMGSGLFIDSRYPLNLAEPTLLYLAFGVAFADFDHDGDVDLIIANGHVKDNAAQFYETSSYAQRNQVMVNEGGRFTELESTGLDVVRVSRGLALGDLEGDGDLDVVVVNSNDLAEVYENLTGATAGSWLVVDLEGETNRHGIGARAALETSAARQIREVRTASSYQSQNALGLHFGLGDAATVAALEITWPGGRALRLESIPTLRRIRVYE